jgi:L-fuculose-phosphate aldolase
VTQKTKVNETEELLSAVRKEYQYAALVQTPAALVCANRGIPIYAQVDDMAQMIGRKISVVSGKSEKIVQALEKVNAVLVPGVGAVVRSECEDDTIALELLVDKSAICSIHTAASNVKARIGFIDSALMRLVYQKKYSKQKN